jgi:hypothetical protein
MLFRLPTGRKEKRPIFCPRTKFLLSVVVLWSLAQFSGTESVLLRANCLNHFRQVILGSFGERHGRVITSASHIIHIFQTPVRQSPSHDQTGSEDLRRRRKNDRSRDREISFRLAPQKVEIEVFEIIAHTTRASEPCLSTPSKILS